jgi:hypothetical protein
MFDWRTPLKSIEVFLAYSIRKNYCRRFDNISGAHSLILHSLLITPLIQNRGFFVKRISHKYSNKISCDLPAVACVLTSDFFICTASRL